MKDDWSDFTHGVVSPHMPTEDTRDHVCGTNDMIGDRAPAQTS
jgi:hypothetical protein